MRLKRKRTMFIHTNQPLFTSFNLKKYLFFAELAMSSTNFVISFILKILNAQHRQLILYCLILYDCQLLKSQNKLPPLQCANSLPDKTCWLGRGLSLNRNVRKRNLKRDHGSKRFFKNLGQLLSEVKCGGAQALERFVNL